VHARSIGCLLVAGTLALTAMPAAAQRGLRGDSAAVAMVERMLAATGGREVWAGARTLRMEYRGRVVTPRALEDREVAWRDLREPNERLEHHGRGVARASAFTPTGGWRTRSGVTRAMTALEHERMLGFWPRDFYTLFHRFAVADPDLHVIALGPGKVVVHSARQGEVGWFEIDSEGAPVRWGTLDDGAPLEYVYGPLRSFGRVRFPAWGARLDGGWRWEYSVVELDAAPIPDSLLRMPRS
jgi:hypothetical protein